MCPFLFLRLIPQYYPPTLAEYNLLVRDFSFAMFSPGPLNILLALLVDIFMSLLLQRDIPNPSRCNDIDVPPSSSRDWLCLQARPQHTLYIEIAVYLFLQLLCDPVEGENHALDCTYP